MCQVEVIVVAIVTGLIVYFVTKRFVKYPILSQSRSGNTAELGPVRTEIALTIILLFLVALLLNL